jgi:ABC-2 type transport system permease protein
MTSKKKENSDLIRIRRTFLWILGIYACMMVLFYFLAGKQLHYRASRGNVEMGTADEASVELVNGTTVEQFFTPQIDLIERVSVLFGTYYRENSGTIVVDVCRQEDQTVLLRQSFDAATIAEGQPLELCAETPLDKMRGCPLVLHITADSPPGMGVTPLVCNKTRNEINGVLEINGERAAGALCFSVSGEDYIWTGLYYWHFVVGFGLALAVLFFVLLRRFEKGKPSYVISALLAVRKYRFLIDQLVSRDFKTRYKRSVLGVLWSLLNPLLMMLVQYFVFSTVFRQDIPNFAAYLIVGVVMFNFFNEACGQTLASIVGNASLITKVYMPKYIYPLTRTAMSVINLLISLIPMVLVCLLTGVRFQKSAILSLYFMACLVIFALGFGMLLATSMVFFRDTQFLWGILSMMWMYATPVFYPERLLQENFEGALKLNLLYVFIKDARICILNGISPEPLEYVRCLGIALAMLAVGAFVFRWKQNDFVLYL